MDKLDIMQEKLETALDIIMEHFHETEERIEELENRVKELESGLLQNVE